MPNTPNGWLLDPARLRQMTAVAALIAGEPYTPDTVSDWTENLAGDCQGKAAWAKRTLRLKGWMDYWMEFWACDLPGGRRHAVLQLNIADMDGKVSEVIIDCRYQTPQIKADLPYTDWCKVR